MAKKDIIIKPNALNNYLEIEIPIGKISKFACKIPNNGFGQIISVCNKNTIIPNNTYIEWQIGYYTDDQARSYSKKSILTNLFSFELSDILIEMKKIGLLTQTEINNHVSTLSTINSFIYGNITMQNQSLYSINNIQFKQKNIILPNYYLSTNTIDINILYEKQQKARSIQPMVFLNIPLSSLTNSSSFLNKNGKGGQRGILKIDNSNKNMMIDLVYAFASLDNNYKNEIISILQTI